MEISEGGGRKRGGEVEISEGGGREGGGVK